MHDAYGHAKNIRLDDSVLPRTHVPKLQGIYRQIEGKCIFSNRRHPCPHPVCIPRRKHFELICEVADDAVQRFMQTLHLNAVTERGKKERKPSREQLKIECLHRVLQDLALLLDLTTRLLRLAHHPSSLSLVAGRLLLGRLLVALILC